MSWVLKILNKDFIKVEKTWTGAIWSDNIIGPADFMINDFKFSESTWREVEYTPVTPSNLIERQDISVDKILTETSPPYQILNPLVEEVFITLPSLPQFNTRYIIKNNSEVNNKLLIREIINGPAIFTLDSTDEFATLFFDSVEWQVTL